MRVRAGEMPPEGKGTPVTPEGSRPLRPGSPAGAAWPEARVLSPFEFDRASGRAATGGRSCTRSRSRSLSRRRQAHPHADRRPGRRALDKSGLTLVGRSRPRDAHSPRHVRPDRSAARRRRRFEQFVADTAPDAYERLIDRLLASPHYGERWARHWLDVVRFGESNGYETNTAAGQRLAVSRLGDSGVQRRPATIASSSWSSWPATSWAPTPPPAFSSAERTTPWAAPTSS